MIDAAESYVRDAVHVDGIKPFWSLANRAIKDICMTGEFFYLFLYMAEETFRFNHAKSRMPTFPWR